MQLKLYHRACAHLIVIAQLLRKGGGVTGERGRREGVSQGREAVNTVKLNFTGRLLYSNFKWN